MFDFLKRKNNPPSSDNTSKTPNGLFRTLKNKLTRSRKKIQDGFADIFLGKKQIDEDILDKLESVLLSADLGLETTNDIIEQLKQELNRDQLKDLDALQNRLKQILINLLKNYESPLSFTETQKPYVILMVGVNGTGKTTTIGKIAKKIQDQGKTVMLVAGDTFRAAAIEQLMVWGERNQIPVIAQQSGADSASVIFDGLQAARARQFDFLIADTAGRLHTQDSLMEELKKIVRVIKKCDSAAPHEIMLVLDAGIGQNSLNQAKKFHDALSVTGITLTKLDGTAKGGIIFNIVKTLKLPIRFVGVGEGIEDLQVFNAEEFVHALFDIEEAQHDSV